MVQGAVAVPSKGQSLLEEAEPRFPTVTEPGTVEPADRFLETMGARLAQALLTPAQAAEIEEPTLVLLARILMANQLIGDFKPIQLKIKGRDGFVIGVLNGKAERDPETLKWTGEVSFFDPPVAVKNEISRSPGGDLEMTTTEPFAVLPISSDIFEKAQASPTAALGPAATPSLTQEVQDFAVLEAVADTLRAVNLAKRINAQRQKGIVAETRTRPKVALAIPVEGRDPREIQFALEFFNVVKPLFNSEVSLVFTKNSIFKDKQGAQLDRAEGEGYPSMILPEGEFKVIVLAHPEADLLKILEGKAGLLPMPKFQKKDDQHFQVGPYAIAYMLADLLGGASEDDLRVLLSDGRFDQILQTAYGTTRYLDLRNQKGDLVRAFLKARVDPAKPDFYLRIIFEPLRPLNWTQLLEVARLLVRAIGSAA